jgi:hypothetical protein
MPILSTATEAEVDYVKDEVVRLGGLSSLRKVPRSVFFGCQVVLLYIFGVKLLIGLRVWLGFPVRRIF